MNVEIKGIKIFKSKISFDNRGFSQEIFKKKKIKSKEFIFYCSSSSKKNVLRGLHLQTKNSQAKYVTVLKGKIFDVSVDLRKNSKTFGKHFSIYLANKSYNSIYIPKGFAHGFYCLEKENIVLYALSNYRNKKSEKVIRWNDKDLKINWPVKKPLLSLKDKKNISFKEYCQNF
jgi:dTDP-4-dehydrorhamnose 3,5-epimerase